MFVHSLDYYYINCVCSIMFVFFLWMLAYVPLHFSKLLYLNVKITKKISSCVKYMLTTYYYYYSSRLVRLKVASVKTYWNPLFNRLMYNSKKFK